MVRVGVIGASGYTGVELLRLIAVHPDFDLAIATADSNAGTPAAQLAPSLSVAFPDLRFEPFDVAEIRAAATRRRLPRASPRGCPRRRAAARRPRRLRRRPLGGVPAPRSGGLSAMVRLRARSARTARPRRVRPPGTHPGRCYPAPGWSPRPGATSQRRRSLWPRCSTLASIEPAGIIVDAASGVSGAGRNPTRRHGVLHGRRELHRLRAARPPAHSGDRAEPRRRRCCSRPTSPR